MGFANFYCQNLFNNYLKQQTGQFSFCERGTLSYTLGSLKNNTINIVEIGIWSKKFDNIKISGSEIVCVKAGHVDADVAYNDDADVAYNDVADVAYNDVADLHTTHNIMGG